MSAPRDKAARPVRKRRALRLFGLGFVVLLVLLAGLLTWLFQSESGAGFVLARVQSALDGKLAVERHAGTLAGPLQLDGVRYRDPASGIDARIGHARIDLGVLALLGGRVEVRSLEAADIDVALSSVAPKPDQPEQPFSLEPPIDIALDQVAIRNLEVHQDGQPVLVVDQLDLGGGWTRQGLLVRSLSLRSPQGHIDMNGTLATDGGYSGHAETTFSWKAAGRDLAGTLKSTSDGRTAHLELSLTAPTAVEADLTVGQGGAAPWNLQLDVPRFAADRVLPDSQLGQLALHLEGHGDRAGGSVSGQAELDGHRVDLDPLRVAVDEGIVTIEALHLSAPEAAGTLEISGTIDSTKAPLTADLDARWSDVELPADLVGQVLASRGELKIDGNAEAFTATGSLALGPPGALADIALAVRGSTETITLETVRLKQANGGLEATGTITLQPSPAWQIEATATHLDPGAFFADWPGAIDFVLKTNGTLTDNGPEATLRLDQVGGTLRERPLGGSADLRMHPGYVVDGTLNLTSGESRLALEGSGGEQTDARVRIDIASLGDWLPSAGGSASGTFQIGGKWPQLDIDGDISGRALAWSGIRADSVELVTKVRDIGKPAGALTLKAENVSRGDVHFDSVLLEGDGNEASHQLSLSAEGSPASLRASLSGGAARGRWQGRLKTLELDPVGRNLPDFSLDAAAAMDWDGQRFELAESCLSGKPGEPRRARTPAAGAETAAPPAAKSPEEKAEAVEPDEPELPARLCAGARTQSDGALAVNYRLEHLPLRLLVRLGAPDSPVRLRGEINGDGDIARSSDGLLTGHATLRSDKGDLFYSGGQRKPLLSYTGFTVEARLEGKSSTARVHAALDHDGLLDGTLRLSPGTGDSQAIEGQVSLDLNSLAFLELVTSELTATEGRLSAKYAIAGTLDAPRLDGNLSVEGFAAEVPSAGLKLHDGQLSLRAADAQRYVLEGRIGSGKGTLTLSGEGGLGADEPMKAVIKGEEFLAADIPAARVVLSPDITVERGSNGFLVTGKVAVPSASVDLARLPGGGASAASPDVVIVDAEQPEPGKPVPLTARVTVSLGDDVKLKGYGFDGTISGDLLVNERPGRATTGSGTLNAGGTYKAYGQNLKIETGRVLFAGTAIDNPGIDIRAVRKIEAANVTAGLLVRGTAQVPVLTVFSEPSMEQSEALSYLVTGKPLSSLKSGEGDMLGTAARALGTAGGDLLAKSIGGRLGVDDIGVADNGALGGAAFTVGKYLSPKLYLSYGVGIFEPGEVVTLRYLFSRHWNFEAQNATTGSRAGINYRIER